MVDSRPAKTETQVRRRRECPKCKRRWTTFEREERGSSTFVDPQLIGAVTTTNCAEQPQLIVSQAKGLSSGSDLKSLQVPELLDPGSSLLSETRAPARNKPQAKGQHAGLIAEFVEQWEESYSDKYLFDRAKDGPQLSRLVREHPEVAGRWPAMVERYLADAFYAKMRHPLYQLATHALQFAGETNGAHALSKPMAATTDGLGRFVANGQGRGAK